MSRLRLLMAAGGLVVVGACSVTSASEDATGVTTTTGPEQSETASANEGSTVAGSEADEFPAPPDLVVDTPTGPVVVRGYDFCWSAPDGSPGHCEDSFGKSPPTPPITIDEPAATITWVAEGRLFAFHDDLHSACKPRLAVEPISPGTWTVAMPPEPGTYTIKLHGEAPQGSTSFSMLATAAAGGSDVPFAFVWWPDTDDDFTMSIDVYGTGADTAALEVQSSDGVTTVLDVMWFVDEQECQRRLQGQTEDIGGNRSLGEPPYVATLHLTTESGERIAVWEWPTDVGYEDELFGVLGFGE